MIAPLITCRCCGLVNSMSEIGKLVNWYDTSVDFPWYCPLPWREYFIYCPVSNSYIYIMYIYCIFQSPTATDLPANNMHQLTCQSSSRRLAMSLALFDQLTGEGRTGPQKASLPCSAVKASSTLPRRHLCDKETIVLSLQTPFFPSIHPHPPQKKTKKKPTHIPTPSINHPPLFVVSCS